MRRRVAAATGELVEGVAYYVACVACHGEDASQRRVAPGREGDEQPQGAVEQWADQVHKGEDDEAEADGADRDHERARQCRRYARDPPLWMIAGPALGIERRQAATAVTAASRRRADLVPTERAGAKLVHWLPSCTVIRSGGAEGSKDFVHDSDELALVLEGAGFFHLACAMLTLRRVLK
jgi:hypothetical protein